MSVIELNKASKWYGEVIGLNNVTASIGEGITGLVGPNGAGKSTLMGLAMGQLKLSKGTIRVLGGRPWNNPAVLSRIGYCPEGDVFWSNLTGRQFVEFLAREYGMSGRTRRDAVLRAIDLTGMTKDANRAIKGYSKGMRQRIKIAQALVHDPVLLVLDEPFTGTDPVGRHELGQLFRRLAQQGVNILISSHVLHEVEALTSRILMINQGRIVAQGDLHAVRNTMHDRPHAIRVRVDDPRRLAIRLAGLEVVAGVKISAEDTLMIETTSPQQVYDLLPEMILDGQLQVREIAAADEGLGAIFEYLTRRSG